METPFFYSQSNESIWDEAEPFLINLHELNKLLQMILIRSKPQQNSITITIKRHDHPQINSINKPKKPLNAKHNTLESKNVDKK